MFRVLSSVIVELCDFWVFFIVIVECVYVIFDYGQVWVYVSVIGVDMLELFDVLIYVWGCLQCELFVYV